MPRIEPLISLLGGIPGAATSARSDLSFQPDDLDERLQRMANGSNDGGGVCQNNNNGSWISRPPLCFSATNNIFDPGSNFQKMIHVHHRCCLDRPQPKATGLP